MKLNYSDRILFFRKKKYYLLLSAIILLLSISKHPVYAQTPTLTPTPILTIDPSFAPVPNFNIATTHPISDPDVEDGDILTLPEGRTALVRSNVTNDERIFGVAKLNPSMVMVCGDRNTLPVVRTGYAEVNVSTLNGEIAIGDYITSSPIPGKGQKNSDKTKTFLGVAMGTFTEKEGIPVDFEGKTYQMGKVMVSLSIIPASHTPEEEKQGITGETGAVGTIQQAVISMLQKLETSREAAKIIRYFLAAIVAVSTIIVNFFTFGKNVSKGIESIGRNPLAKVSIQSMIVLNIVLIAVVSIGGIVLSLIIISL